MDAYSIRLLVTKLKSFILPVVAPCIVLLSEWLWTCIKNKFSLYYLLGIQIPSHISFYDLGFTRQEELGCWGEPFCWKSWSSKTSDFLCVLMSVSTCTCVHAMILLITISICRMWMKNCYMILSAHLVSSSQILRFYLYFSVYLQFTINISSIGIFMYMFGKWNFLVFLIVCHYC